MSEATATSPFAPTGKADAQTLKKKSDPRVVTRDDHERIQAAINLEGDEDYTVTIQKGKGYWVKSVHVFKRQPTAIEIHNYEQQASRVKFKGGNRAELEGSQINAAVGLYNLLIDRAYDVLVGVKKHAQLSREDAVNMVTALVKREAVRELIGETYSASRMAEAVGDDQTDDDDNPESHT